MARVKCPCCARDFVRPIASAGFLETALTVLCVRPFKCQLCGHRFRSLSWDARSVRSREDHRQYSRMQRQLPIAFSGEGIAGHGMLQNISMGGCCFTTGADLPAGMIMRLSLQIVTDVPPVTVDAAVVRHTRKRTAGLEFKRWQERERERLQAFIKGMLIRHGTEADLST